MNNERSPFEPQKQTDKNVNLKIAGYNLAAMLMYGLGFVGVMGNDGLILFGLSFLGHAFVCLIVAIVQRKWVWVLSSVLIVIIGFSTCANLFHLDMH